MRYAPFAFILVMSVIQFPVPLQAADNVKSGPFWLISSSTELQSPPPPASVDADLNQLRKIVAERKTADLERISWWSVGGPSYRWNELILDEMLKRFVTQPLASRHLALVHAAFDDAIAATFTTKKLYGRSRPSQVDPSLSVTLAVPDSPSYPSDFAAAATVAVDLVGYLMPEAKPQFQALAEEAIRTRLLAGVEFPSDVAAGRELGRKVAALAIERGRSDGSDRVWSGAVPQGPGRWTGANPVAPQAAAWKPFVMDRPDMLRPAPPPGHDSAEIKAQLDELKTFKRTPQTNNTAIYWEVFGGVRIHHLWNQTARSKILEYGLDPPAAARVLAIMNIAVYDAAVACWDAKYAYWYIRPSQLDPDHKPLFPAPSHPSYPAAHGCLSTAAAATLAALFPADAKVLAEMGRQAAESRISAGIHYRMDTDIGQRMGREVADLVMRHAAGR